MKSLAAGLVDLLRVLPTTPTGWARSARIPVATLTALQNGAQDLTPFIDCAGMVAHLGYSVTLRGPTANLGSWPARKSAKIPAVDPLPANNLPTMLGEVLARLIGSIPTVDAFKGGPVPATRLAQFAIGPRDFYEEVATIERAVAVMDGAVVVTPVWGGAQPVELPLRAAMRVSRKGKLDPKPVLDLANETNPDGTKRWTYQQIGTMLGVTRQAVAKTVARYQPDTTRTYQPAEERHEALNRLNSEFTIYQP